MGRISTALAQVRRTGAALAVALVAGMVASSDAAGAVGVDDPCGLGATTSSNVAPIYPEPQVGWLDVCRLEVFGVAGAGPLRAVQMELELREDVSSGAGAAYNGRLDTGLCWVEVRLRIYSAALHEKTSADGHCGYRTEPCDWPESELPNRYCGSYVDRFDLRDDPVLSVDVDGRFVTLTFDPNRFPQESLPGGLAQDLGPQNVDDDPAGAEGRTEEYTYGSLETGWASATVHQGVDPVFWVSGGFGDMTPRTGPVPLD